MCTPIGIFFAKKSVFESSFYSEKILVRPRFDPRTFGGIGKREKTCVELALSTLFRCPRMSLRLKTCCFVPSQISSHSKSEKSSTNRHHAQGRGRV